MGENSPERKTGCGILNAMFGRRSFLPKKTTTISTGHVIPPPNGAVAKTTTPQEPKRRRGSSEEVAFLVGGGGSGVPPQQPKPLWGISTNTQRAQCGPDKNDIRRPQTKTSSTPYQVYVSQGRRVPKEAVGISGELESMIIDHQKTKGSSNLVRASSSNVMLFGNLGNLRQQNGGGGGHNNNNTTSYNAREGVPVRYAKNVVNAKGGSEEQSVGVAGSLCRALSTRMDPETLKIMGNEDYKNGRFAEALALYDAAISIDPNKASYRSNKSAALTALGRLLEAVLECKEAIRIEPHYHRAHHRLATLYLRLGEPEKATYHYKHAGQEADQYDLAKVKSLQTHLNKCTEARKLRDWNTLIKETECVISAGADSAPQIYALQAEALLKLHRHQEADKAMSRGPKFDVDECTKFLGPIGNANLLVTRAQVDMAIGRFDDALEAAQRASRLDSNNRESSMVMRKARVVATARSKGNELFRTSRFLEACVAYGEGLEHDPYNSVMLCNRAACRSKLGHLEKAIEDCTAALNVRPSYSKARLRRADCNAKLERWEASIQDYEILLQERPEDEEVRRALSEAQAQLKKQQGRDTTEADNSGATGVDSP